LEAMARPLRVEFAGALYHLTGRGNSRRRIFADEGDCAKFVQLLIESLRRYEVVLHAYVLMGNHYHLMAETRRANLGRWMHWLTTAYTVYFNRRHKRAGHLFQGRYKSIVVEAEGYLLSLSRYVHLNPVRGKVMGRGDPIERRKLLRSWRWSSYRGYSGLAKAEPWVTQERVLGEIGGRARERRVRYRRFVEEGLLREIESPWEAVQWQTALGREHFLQRLKDHVEKRRQGHREVPALRQLRRQPEAQFILKGVARAYGCSKEHLLSRGTRGNEARAVAMTLVWDCCGLNLQEVGELFGGTGYTAISQMIRRTRQKDQKGMLRFKLDQLIPQMCKVKIRPHSWARAGPGFHSPTGQFTLRRRQHRCLGSATG
jgi:putative transposase